MRLELFPFPFIIGLVLLLLLIVILRLAKRSWAYLFFFSALWVYLLFLVGLIIFPIPLVPPLKLSEIWSSFQSALPRIYLIPHNYTNLDLYPFYYNFEIIANVLLTIPFGFLVVWVFPRLINKMLLVAFAVGLFNEASQFLLLVLWGFSYRVVDINDVFLNASGVLIGFVLFIIIHWSVRKIVKLFRIQPKGIVQYMLEIGTKEKRNSKK